MISPAQSYYDPATSPVTSYMISPAQSYYDPATSPVTSYMISPAQSYYDPATSLVTLDIQDDSECLSLGSQATMDQHLAADGDLLLGDSSELPLLSMPLLPIPVADVSVPESVATPSAGEPFLVSSVVSPDLSQEGPFDAGQTASGSGTAPHVLDSLLGC